MSVKDLNKCIIISDCFDGHIIETLDFDNTEDFCAFVPCNYNEVRILYHVLKSIGSEHGCYVKVGYNN